MASWLLASVAERGTGGEAASVDGTRAAAACTGRRCAAQGGGASGEAAASTGQCSDGRRAARTWAGQGVRACVRRGAGSGLNSGVGLFGRGSGD